MRGVASVTHLTADRSVVTSGRERMRNDSGEDEVRRSWESMSLTKVGTFGDVLRGDTGMDMDTGGTMKK
jgi:hypothetical protein